MRPFAMAGYANADAFWLPDSPPTSRVGYSGAPQTISVMQRAILDDHQHFEVRQLVESICERVQSKDYVSEYLACFYFLLQHTRYMRDPRRTELVRAPYIIAQQILAGHTPSVDCDDLATLLGAMILALGGTGWIVTVAFNDAKIDGVPQFSHVFVVALEPRTRAKIVLDPVAAERTSEMLRRVRQKAFWGPFN